MGLLNGILKGIRDACDALIDEPEEDGEGIETREIETTGMNPVQAKAARTAAKEYAYPYGAAYNNERAEPDIDRSSLDNYKIGKMFEDYALRLFPAEGFNIIHKTVGGADLDGRYTEDCVNPDYKFRDRATGQEFWVECKYRSHRGEKGNITWTDMRRLNRYKQIRQESGIPLFVLVGIGGEPDDPNELLFFNLDKAGYATIFYSVQKDMILEDRPYACLGEMCEGNRFAA